MSPRKRIAGVRTADEGAEHLSAPHEGIDADDLSPDVERVLAEIGENASVVVVWREKEGKPGEWDYVSRIPASEYTNEYVKEQYGGGVYKIIVVDVSQGALNPVFLSIDKRFVGRAFTNLAPSAVAQSSGDTFKERLLEVLLTKMLTQPAPAPARDDLDYVLKIAAVFKDGGGGGDVARQLATIIDTAKTLAEGMNPPDGLAGVAAQFLPVIERIVPRQAAPTTVRQIPRTTTPQPAPARVTVHTNHNEPTQAAAETAPTSNAPATVAGSIVPKWLAPFRSLAPTLVALADGGSDATIYADVAVDHMAGDEDTFVAAVEAMNEARLLSDLYALAPALERTDARKKFAATLVEKIEEGLRDLIANADNNAEDASNG